MPYDAPENGLAGHLGSLDCKDKDADAFQKSYLIRCSVDGNADQLADQKMFAAE
jgi:hypothetical protein